MWFVNQTNHAAVRTVSWHKGNHVIAKPNKPRCTWFWLCQLIVRPAAWFVWISRSCDINYGMWVIVNDCEKLYIACLQTNSLAMIIILSWGNQKVVALPYIDYGLSHWTHLLGAEVIYWQKRKRINFGWMQDKYCSLSSRCICGLDIGLDISICSCLSGVLIRKSNRNK